MWVTNALLCTGMEKHDDAGFFLCLFDICNVSLPFFVVSEALFTVSFLWLRTVRVVSVLTHYICLSHLSTDAPQHMESILWMQYASLNMGGIWASVLCRGHEVRQNHLKLLHHCKTRDCTAGWSSGVLCTWKILTRLSLQEYSVLRSSWYSGVLRGTVVWSSGAGLWSGVCQSVWQAPCLDPTRYNCA